MTIEGNKVSVDQDGKKIVNAKGEVILDIKDMSVAELKKSNNLP